MLSKMMLVCGAAAIVSFAMSQVAVAQQVAKWSDVDCAQSHLVGPAGLKCRATNVYSGGNAATSSAAGTFQHRNMSGTVGNAKLFYFLKEGTDSQAYIIPISMQDTVVGFSLVGKNAKDFSATSPIAGGDFARFTGAADDACIAVRKNGPSRSKGFKYYILATKCVPKGQTIPDSDAGALLASINASS